MRWGLKFKPLTENGAGIWSPSHMPGRSGDPPTSIEGSADLIPAPRCPHVHVPRGTGLAPRWSQPRRGAFHVGVQNSHLAGLVCQTVPGRVTLFQMADDFLSDNRLLKTQNYHVITMT